MYASILQIYIRNLNFLLIKKKKIKIRKKQEIQ